MASFEFSSKVVCAGSKLAAWNAVAFFKQSPCFSKITRAVNCFNVLSNLGLNELPCSSVSAEFSEECAFFNSLNFFYKLSCSL